ncbi:hypothetical protein CEXT_220661 [Caerostris extrusa]|uniref:Uncharacterized protein n=1 Tax=Caerostris extrusa TaxID=172846 RepID=A0AAV4VQ79_CAEEX|nr:hypothetical protein CEXT_220661 [Caerostris extrusa]
MDIISLSAAENSISYAALFTLSTMKFTIMTLSGPLLFCRDSRCYLGNAPIFSDYFYSPRKCIWRQLFSMAAPIVQSHSKSFERCLEQNVTSQFCMRHKFRNLLIHPFA